MAEDDNSGGPSGPNVKHQNLGKPMSVIRVDGDGSTINPDVHQLQRHSRELFDELKDFLNDTVVQHLQRGGSSGPGDGEGGGAPGLSRADVAAATLTTQQFVAGVQSLEDGVSAMVEQGVRRKDFEENLLKEEKRRQEDREELEKRLVDSFKGVEDAGKKVQESLNKFDEQTQAREKAMREQYDENQKKLAQNFVNFFAVGSSRRLIQEQWIRQTAGMINDLRQGLVNNVSEFLSGRYFLKTLDSYKTALDDLSQRGLMNFSTMLDQVRNRGANLVVALEQMTQDLQENRIGSFAMFRGTIGQYATELREQRRLVNAILGGGGMFNEMNFRQQNEYLMLIHRQMVREGDRVLIGDRSVAMRAAQEYEIYRQIAANTGRTVEEVIKLQEETRTSINEALAMGVITEEEAANFRANAREFQAFIPEEAMQRMHQALRYMDQGGATYMLRDDEAWIGSQAAMAIDDLIEAWTSGTSSMEESFAALERIDINNIPAEWAEQIAPLIVARNEMRAAMDAGDRTVVQDSLSRTLRQVGAWWQDEMQPFAALASGIMGAVSAIGAHTAAMIIHAAALTNNAAGGGIGRWLGRGGRGVAGRLGMGALRMGGIAAILGVVGSSVVDTIEGTSEEEMSHFAGTEQQQEIRARIADMLPGIVTAGVTLIAGILGLIFGGIPVLLIGSLTAIAFVLDQAITGGAITRWISDKIADVMEFDFVAWKDSIFEWFGNLVDSIMGGLWGLVEGLGNFGSTAIEAVGGFFGGFFDERSPEVSLPQMNNVDSISSNSDEIMERAAAASRSEEDNRMMSELVRLFRDVGEGVSDLSSGINQVVRNTGPLRENGGVGD